jgi:peptide-methionine (R)-S-oxide reductase
MNNMHRLVLIVCILAGLSMNACLQSNPKAPAVPSSLKKEMETSFVNAKGETIYIISKTDAEWKNSLDPDAYHVLRERGTERAFSGEYNANTKAGTYMCNACQLPLFSSDAKFDSGTGWPSFYQPIDPQHVMEIKDVSHGMTRVEILCHRCGGHLGHVFDDGPKPTGLRYCMNSVSLNFKPE